ncbi:MAG: FAD-dependent oxidoreductase [Bacteroidales bacterium]|nr:FAD-dependent oxidoreductase [Bacteroidales bacterium]
MKRSIAIITLLAVAGFCASAQVLVETESFDDKGGWVIDHQAFEKIQSSYLMANGKGVPVEDACTTVHFDKPGKYHVYVSTYNWTSPWYDGKGPGEFAVSIDGEELPNTLGTTGNSWEWQYAGEVEVAATAVVSLKDKTGFNGRADAIWFSKEKSAPDPDYKSLDRQNLLGYPETPVGYKADFVVVGGGISGCTAALTAARYGMNVILVDNLPWLGGNAVMGVHIDGAAFKNRYPNLGYAACDIAGIIPEKKNDASAYKMNKNNGIGGAIPSAYLPSMNDPVDMSRSEILKTRERLKAAGDTVDASHEKAFLKEEIRRQNGAINRERVLLEAGVTIFHNIHVFQAATEGGKITSVTGRDLHTGQDYSFSAPLFADCTGDGTVGYLAGADFAIGREGRSYADEPSAPAKPDDKKMGSTIAWAAYPRPEPGTFPTPEQLPWAMQFDSDYNIRNAQWAWWMETGLEIDNATEAELVRDNYFRAVYGNWAYLKNNDPDYADYRLDYMNHIAMKRESRRLLGDVVLNENDISSKKAFPDASFTTTWTMDVHSARKTNSQRFPGWEWLTNSSNGRPEAKVGRYDVPYRCLYSRNIDNLFIGGRNMSVTHMALGTVRVQLTLGMAGEVIGMAGSICHNHGSLPRSVYSDYLNELKSCMLHGVPGSISNPGRLTILPIGDSITQGSGNCTSYTYPLWKLLKEAGYDFEYLGPRSKTYDVGVLRHCGIGGKNTEYFVPRIDSLYMTYPADVVLIHSGHNHFIEENPVQGIIESHRTIIDHILAINPDAVIFVAQVIESGKLPKYSYIPDLNKEIKKMVKSYHSKNVLLVNAGKGFDWHECTADDMVHPNPKGAEVMAGNWFKALRRKL